MQIILASASYRRQKLLASLGIKFKVITSDLDEERIKQVINDPRQLVSKLALKKALIISQQLKAKKFLIISADTVVALKNSHGWIILGKPKNRLEAEQMLKLLRQKTHQVFTGLVLLNNRAEKEVIVEETKVLFNNFSDKQLKAYLDTGVYLDRAGAYGIQDEKCNFIKEYQGSYSNILGLPLKKLTYYLKKIGVTINCSIDKNELN